MEINITLIMQLAIFLMLLFFLSRVLFQPLLALFDERERRIEGAKKEAALLQKEADKCLLELEEKIKRAQAEGKRVLSELKEQGVHYQQSLIENSRQEAKIELEKARLALEADVKTAKMQLQNSVAGFVALSVESVVRSDVVNEQATGSSHSASKMECSNA